MKIKYTDEATFKTEEMEFPDEQYNLATTLHKQYESDLSECSPILVRSRSDKI